MSTDSPRTPSPDGPRVVAAVMGLLAVVGLYAFLHSPYFELAELEVRGTVTIPADEIVALIDVRHGDNLLAVDMRAIARIVASHPRVKRAAIDRRLPGTLIVTVVEHEAMVLLEGDEGLTAVTRDGNQIPFSANEAARLPVVPGDQSSLLDAFSTIAMMMPPDLRASTSRMFVQDDMITLHMRTGETILLGDDTALERKLDIARDLLGQRRYVVIDVRFPAFPTVRTNDE